MERGPGSRQSAFWKLFFIFLRVNEIALPLFWVMMAIVTKG